VQLAQPWACRRLLTAATPPGYGLKESQAHVSVDFRLVSRVVVTSVAQSRELRTGTLEERRSRALDTHMVNFDAR